jgi:hypothetical protein
MKVVLMIVAVIIGLIFIGDLMPDAINSVATEPYTENFETVTGGGETTADETLSYANYFGDLTDMSVISDNGDDSPAILDYDEADYTTTIGGLHASDSRILTITYAREANQEFPGMSQFLRLMPFLLIIGLVGVCLWGLYSSWQKRHRGFE